MVFCFVQKYFFGQHESYNIWFFFRSKREFFFQNLTLGYMTKTLNQNIFLEKKHNPSPFKLNGPSLTLYDIMMMMSV